MDIESLIPGIKQLGLSVCTGTNAETSPAHTARLPDKLHAYSGGKTGVDGIKMIQAGSPSVLSRDTIPVSMVQEPIMNQLASLAAQVNVPAVIENAISTTKATDIHRDTRNWAQGWRGRDVSGNDRPMSVTPLESKISETAAAIVAPREKNLGKQSGCKLVDCQRHCQECDIHCNSQETYNQHITSKGHEKKLESLAADEAPFDPDNPFPYFPFFCPLCQRPFNSKRSEEAHYRGKSHQSKVLNFCKVPERDLPPICKKCTAEDCDDFSYSLTESFPRNYQLELYTKAMDDDVICFLPTGE